MKALYGADGSMELGILSSFQSNFIASLFWNYEQPKLDVAQPNILTIYFLCAITLVTLITLRKTVNDQPLSFLQTEQMKGFAIIIIIFHHLCYYIIKPYPELEYWRDIGEAGVSVFLILSGYGLYVSIKQKGIKDFFVKRFTRIFVPVLFAMFLKVILNHILLHEKSNIFIDIGKIFVALDNIDKTMWFIIFILFWYCLTYLSFQLNLSNQGKLIFFCSVSMIFISIPQILFMWKTNAFSFPLGCWLGLNSKLINEKIRLLLKQNIVLLMGLLLSGLLLSTAIYYKIRGYIYGYYHGLIAMALIIIFAATIYVIYKVKNKTKVAISLENLFLYITVIVVVSNYLGMDKSNAESGNLTWFLFTNFSIILLAITMVLLVSMLVKFNVYSLFLSWTGKISFELYLLHGMFMYSFDFILFRGNIMVTFLIYFVAICLGSIVLQQLSSITSNWLLQRLSRLELGNNG